MSERKPDGASPPEPALNGAEPLGDGWALSLPHFEGPLDLLLHLCQKHELNVLDIPIGFVTEKYLEFLAVMQLMNLDIASEYLVMAATLAHIKSKMLLPAPPPGQEDEASLEEEDPREALIRRLLEYQKYKLAAQELEARGVAGRDVFLRGAPLEEAVHTGLAPLAEVPLFTLVEAFQNVLSRTKVKLTHDIVADRISLSDRIHELVKVLSQRRRLEFAEIFEGLTTRFDLVITFLALLEMTKLRLTRLVQTEPLAPLYIEYRGETEDEGTAPTRAHHEETHEVSPRQGAEVPQAAPSGSSDTFEATSEETVANEEAALPESASEETP